jgi:hypothetical protein
MNNVKKPTETIFKECSTEFMEEIEGGYVNCTTFKFDREHYILEVNKMVLDDLDEILVCGDFFPAWIISWGFLFRMNNGKCVTIKDEDLKEITVYENKKGYYQDPMGNYDMDLTPDSEDLIKTYKISYENYQSYCTLKKEISINEF